MSTATEPRERPILMHERSVLGIQGERKTQTRRIVKPQPEQAWNCWLRDGGEIHVCRNDHHRSAACEPEFFARCPYGAPGDLLYVRECWRPWGWNEGQPFVIEYRADGGRQECRTEHAGDEYDMEQWEERQWIRISDEMRRAGVKPDEDGMYHSNEPLSWRPSIHMPKWAARIWLEVTGVRVERVQDISEADAVAEGVTMVGPSALTNRTSFARLWDETNGHRDGCTWEDNPWVWVIEFRKVER